MFRVIATEPFLNEITRYLDKEELVKFSKFKNKLKINPYIGRGLRVPFVREFKTIKGKRAYFIIYEEFNLILFVLLSNKKNQTKVIKKLFKKLDEYYLFAKHYNS